MLNLPRSEMLQALQDAMSLAVGWDRLMVLRFTVDPVKFTSLTFFPRFLSWFL